MLGSFLDRIAASLGKSFLFAGLLPAGALMALLSIYWLGVPQTWNKIPSFAGDEIKRTSAIGVAWLSSGFILFALRTWIFSLFQIMPTGLLGSWVINRQLRKRAKLQEKRRLLEWQITVVRWCESDLSAEKAIFVPNSIPTPSCQYVISKSKRALNCIEALRSKEDPSIAWFSRRKIVTGLAALFIATKNRGTYKDKFPSLDCEIGAWRKFNKKPFAKINYRHLVEQLNREWAAVFAKTLRFANGPWIYPTAVGNRIAALDDYSERRYGITTGVIWDRLWFVLPDEIKQEVSDARLGVEVMLNLAAALLIAVVVIAMAELNRAIPLVANWSPVDDQIRGFILIPTCVSIIAMAYRGAVFATDTLSTKVSSAVDMNCLKLIHALGLSATTVGEVKELLSELDGFFVQGTLRRPGRRLSVSAVPRD